MRFFAALWLLLAGPAGGSAEEDIPAVEVDRRDSDAVAAMKIRIESEPALADLLARRILRSKLAEVISGESDPQKRLDVIRDWIGSDAGSAALLAVGLGKDDAEGGTHYEDMLSRRVKITISDNPNAKNNIFGRLKKSSSDSKLLNKDQKMTDEEKREILKTLFEGKGGDSNKIITQEDAQAPAAAGLSGPGYYDRLSRGNLTGYSAELLAMQSALNARRAPGAPRLIETGKLDYQTLSYPAYAMRYDLAELSRRLEAEKKFARENGALAPRDRAGQSAPGPLSPRAARREKALRRLETALLDFDATARESQEPSRITRELLASLADKQRQAARWIRVASLEEDLARLEFEEDFLRPELLRIIDAAPLSEDARAAYKKRGSRLKEKASELRRDAEAALAALEAGDWTSRLERADALVKKNAGSRKTLSRDIKNFVAAPHLLYSLHDPKPRWRRLVERAVRRFLPSSAYARRLARAEQEQDVLKEVFLQIARGDLDAAHAVLGSVRPP